MQPAPHKTLAVSTSSDDLLHPSCAPESLPGLRNSLSDQELNCNTKEKSLDYYNFCAPKLPAHSNNQNKSLSLRNKLTLSSGRKSLDEVGSPDYADNKDSTLKHTQNSSGSPVGHSPAYASIDDFDLNLGGGPQKGSLKHRSSSCDCLEVCDHNNDSPKLQDCTYDKLVPLDQGNTANVIVYDRLAPSKEGLKSSSSSPDPTDSLSTDVHQRSSYTRKAHMYEYIDGEMEERGSEKSRSSSPDGMEHPSNWTNSLPISMFRRKNIEADKKLSRQSLSKETNTLSRRKHLPLQESVENKLFEAKCSSVTKVNPPRLSRESSVENYHSQEKLMTDSTRIIMPSADSIELLSSTESVSKSRSGSASSAEQETKRFSAVIQARREHSNSPIHRVTHEAVEIKKKTDTDFQSYPPSKDPPPIPERETPSKDSLRGKRQVNCKAANGSPPLPPRTQEPRFTVPLPHAQFDFVKPPPPPRPRMLYSPGISYAAVTFSNGDTTPTYSHVEAVTNNQRSSVKVSQTASDVSYASVDFQMTAGLQRTSEQVADHQREFFETRQI